MSFSTPGLEASALGAAVGVQDRTECFDCIAMRSVVDVHASAFGLDQSGPPELGQVVAHGRLGESQGTVLAADRRDAV
jgi:hypothetical protein